MKKKKLVIFTFLILTIATTVYGFTADIIERLSLQKQSANLYILNDFVGDWTSGSNFNEDTGGASNTNSIDNQLKQFQIPNSRTLSSIISGDKVGAAKELCAYVKEYVESPEFLAAYKAKREKAKPTSEPYRPDAATINLQKSSLKQTEAQYVQLKKNKMIPASALSQMEKGIADMKQQIAEWDNPAPNKTRWEKMYPEDASVVVKNRLQEYLAVAATVDFSATLTPAGRKRKFTNPAYENQSLKWKAIYRAGKDVNDEVKAFVNNWLKEGIITADKK